MKFKKAQAGITLFQYHILYLLIRGHDFGTAVMKDVNTICSRGTQHKVHL